MEIQDHDSSFFILRLEYGVRRHIVHYQFDVQICVTCYICLADKLDLFQQVFCCIHIWDLQKWCQALQI
jgi:hypothetical protein